MESSTRQIGEPPGAGVTQPIRADGGSGRALPGKAQGRNLRGAGEGLARLPSYRANLDTLRRLARLDRASGDTLASAGEGENLCDELLSWPCCCPC